jgi:phage gp36-like protein
MVLKQFSGKQFAPGNFGITQFSGGSATPQPGPGPCDGVYYADRADIELIFGNTNVVTWADVDNDGDDTLIVNRICWALQLSHYQINDRLTGGAYVIPFVIPYPVQIIDCCARLAGVLLYESRGIIDATDTQKPRNTVTYHRDLVEKTLRAVLDGRMQFLGQMVATNVMIVPESATP